MARLGLLVFKLICYLALLAVLAGIASLVFVSTMDVCPRLDEGDIACTNPFYESLASFGMVVVLATVFTGLPGLLALGGVVFLIRDLLNLRRRSAPPKQH